MTYALPSYSNATVYSGSSRPYSAYTFSSAPISTTLSPEKPVIRLYTVHTRSSFGTYSAGYVIAASASESGFFLSFSSTRLKEMNFSLPWLIVNRLIS